LDNKAFDISLIFTTVLHSVNLKALHHLMAHNAAVMIYQLNWRNCERFSSIAAEHKKVIRMD